MQCPHRFKAAHYCSYICVPDLLQIVYPDAQTADERLLFSVMCSAKLWNSVQERELSSLAVLLHRGEFSLEAYQHALKLVEHCLAIDSLLLAQGTIARSSLLFQKPDLHFRLSPPLTSPWSYVGALSAELVAAHYSDGHLQVVGRLPHRLQAHLLTHHEQFIRYEQQMSTLLQSLFVEYPANTVVSFEEFVPDELLALSQRTMQAYHPSPETEAAVRHDAHTFIIIHQIFEVWFLSAIAAIEEAITALQAHPPQILTAEGYVRRLAEILRLCTEMIRLPQTMSAADYLAFRFQIRGGSGAESIQFRMLELLLGLRDPQYRSNLEQMRLMTPALERLFEGPSLHTAFLDAVRTHGIVASHDGPITTARNLSHLFCPTGAENPHADLMGLAEALLDTEQWFQQWRFSHMLMVDRMIGNQRPSLGVGGKAADRRGDSKPYLLSTLDYTPIFPELWAARNYMQANKRSGGVVSSGALVEPRTSCFLLIE